MLQFQLRPNPRYSLAELAQMAIEGGCGWIVLSAPGVTDEALREEFAELVPLCREAEVILTVEDRPEAAREHGLHGVYLSSTSGISPAKVREELGAEAIIGVEAGSASTIRPLEAMDIDYAVLSPTLSIDKCEEIIRDVRSAGATLPIVAAFPPTAEIAAELISRGASGILAGKYISGADDPVEATRRLTAAIAEAGGNA